MQLDTDTVIWQVTFVTSSGFTGTVSHKEAERIEEEIARRLLSSKKLSLVLDLDHTLIHAAVENNMSTVPQTDQYEDLFEFTLPPNPLRYFVKLRFLILVLNQLSVGQDCEIF